MKFGNVGKGDLIKFKVSIWRVYLYNIINLKVKMYLSKYKRYF